MFFNAGSSSLLSLSFSLLTLLLSPCSAKLLLETIPSLPQLSRLQSYITKLPRLSAQLAKVDNYTFLAPTNDALDKWISAGSPGPSLDDIEAALFYHLLHGIYPMSSFAVTSQFVPSFLTNTSYTNVTAGQAVELSVDDSLRPLIRSGNSTNTSVTTSDVVTTGGLIQIVSSMLQIPAREPIVVRNAQLSFFIGLLTKGGFLSASRDTFTTQLTNIPNTVYFAPNTAKALSQFPNMTTDNPGRLTELLEYHVVSGKALYSTDLKNGMNLTTLEGRKLMIRVGKDGSKFVNGARVVETDFLVANGVLHTIDSLLDPDKITSPVLSRPNTGLSTAAIAGVIVSVIVLLFLLGGTAYILARRKNMAVPFIQSSKPKISYPIYNTSRHELGIRDSDKTVIWMDERGGQLASHGVAYPQAVELGSGQKRGQAWELHAGEKEGR